MTQRDRELRHEAEAAVAARRELGPEYEDHVAAGLAERVEQLAAIQIAEGRTAGEVERLQAQAEQSTRTQRFVLGIISLGAGIPITAIAAVNVENGLLGVAISWAGIVGVNAVHAVTGRRSR